LKKLKKTSLMFRVRRRRKWWR